MVPDTKGKNLKEFINKHLEEGARLNTDEWRGYKGLSDKFKHGVVKHNTGQYVQGDIHTNTLEGFWSLLKRGLNGIYHRVSPKHLQRYVDEFVFRHNTRQETITNRFNMLLKSTTKHLAYKDLVLEC